MDLRVILFGFGATALGFHFWRNGSRASSLIRGTATSKIGSAAKGYAEIQGRASAPSDSPLRDPITKLPCLWYAVVTEKFSFLDKCQWRTVGTARSSRPFVIDDGSGRCLVSPSEAEIDEREENTIVKDRWNLRHRVWWIREGEPVYAIGYLQRTTDLTVQTILREPGGLRGPAQRFSDSQRDEHALKERTSRILRFWKQDPGEIVGRFDADGDGKIDLKEWDAAQDSARAKAAGQLGLGPQSDAAPSTPDEALIDSDISHRLVEPPDGRPFLLSRYGERSLISSNRKRSFWGLAFFVIGVCTLLSLLHSCVEGK
jgi:hypothetical protein